MNLRKILLVAFVLSGIAALIYELTWIRPLQFLLGSTTYTISIIFAAFMGGLALGSVIITKYIDKIEDLPSTYALMELGIGLYGVLLLSLFNILPNIYNKIYAIRQSFYLFEFVQFALVFTILLIPTTLMGATFAVVTRYYTKEKIGKAMGEIYSANTLGAIIGSLAAGFILIPLLGIKGAIILAGALNLLIGFSILVVTNKYQKWIPTAIIVFFVLALIGNYNIQQMHSGGFYRTHESNKLMGDVAYYKEGLYSTITVRDIASRGYALFTNGKSQGSTEINDLRVNFLLSYLPILINPKNENSLVIGLGTGTTSGQLAQLTNVTTIEIEPAVIEAANYFTLFNEDVLTNKNHKLIIDDGRNYLLKTKEKYDAIIPEPSDPWQSFSAALFSQEFFSLGSKHLNENGLYVQWAPIYQMSTKDFKNFYKTFNSVFPSIIAFANIKPTENTPVKYDTSQIILIGSKEPIQINKDKIKERYNNLPAKSKQHLESLRLSSGEEIFNLLLFTEKDLENYTADAKLITDDKPILEFSTARNVLNQNPKEVIGDIEKSMENE